MVEFQIKQLHFNAKSFQVVLLYWYNVFSYIIKLRQLLSECKEYLIYGVGGWDIIHAQFKRNQPSKKPSISFYAWFRVWYIMGLQYPSVSIKYISLTSPNLM